MYDVKNRVLVTITEQKNIISLSTDQGIRFVKIISARPYGDVDFRDYPSLVIKVEKDGFEESKRRIMEFVKGKNKKKKTAYFPGEEFSFSGFTDLKIIIEETTLDLRKYKIDLWLYIR